MNETVKQVGASILAFVGGYAACMAANHVGSAMVFDWACVTSGLAALGTYHAGLAQSSPYAGK